MRKDFEINDYNKLKGKLRTNRWSTLRCMYCTKQTQCLSFNVYMCGSQVNFTIKQERNDLIEWMWKCTSIQIDVYSHSCVCVYVAFLAWLDQFEQQVYRFFFNSLLMDRTLSYPIPRCNHPSRTTRYVVVDLFRGSPVIIVTTRYIWNITEKKTNINYVGVHART